MIFPTFFVIATSIIFSALRLFEIVFSVVEPTFNQALFQAIHSDFRYYQIVAYRRHRYWWIVLIVSKTFEKTCDYNERKVKCIYANEYNGIIISQCSFKYQISAFQPKKLQNVTATHASLNSICYSTIQPPCWDFGGCEGGYDSISLRAVWRQRLDLSLEDEVECVAQIVQDLYRKFILLQLFWIILVTRVNIKHFITVFICCLLDCIQVRPHIILYCVDRYNYNLIFAQRHFKHEIIQCYCSICSKLCGYNSKTLRKRETLSVKAENCVLQIIVQPNQIQ
ncbi:Hypothetical_protein [Hexamita inflata]|uniref:Hypothetical_protein n=1 Tax=Hexamita inflata TaxID=28002 RepID=A0ABP1GWA7_9EUKA